MSGIIITDAVPEPVVVDPNSYFLVSVSPCGHEGWLPMSDELRAIFFPVPVECEMCAGLEGEMVNHS